MTSNKVLLGERFAELPEDEAKRRADVLIDYHYGLAPPAQARQTFGQSPISEAPRGSVTDRLRREREAKKLKQRKRRSGQ